MKIEITVPDEAIQRIADKIKGEYKRAAMKQGKNIEIKIDGVELIKGVLQGKIDELYLSTDPEYIESMQAARKLKEDGEKKAKDKLEAGKK